MGILRWPAISWSGRALIQAARIWTRAADFEPFYVDADVDTDVRLLLEPYRKPCRYVVGNCAQELTAGLPLLGGSKVPSPVRGRVRVGAER